MYPGSQNDPDNTNYWPLALLLLIVIAVALSGCAARTTCVDGKLYYRDSSDTLVRDEWNRQCIEDTTHD